MHELPQVPFTGEISAPMLLDLGVDGVLLGHSERRQHFGETDAALAEKLAAALDAGLDVILAVGESRASGRRADRVGAGPPGDDRARGQLATGSLTSPTSRSGRSAPAAPPRRRWPRRRTPSSARLFRSPRDGHAIQYGGSMKPENAAELLAQPDIDGGLIGGASLDAASFLAIAAAAGEPPVARRAGRVGARPRGPGNAVDQAETPAFDGSGPAGRTDAGGVGRAVGLPDGQQGNSEVGHLNLGAGRVVRQDLVRIEDEIASGAFFENEVLATPAAAPPGRRCI